MPEPAPGPWRLFLYVVGPSCLSLEAQENLRRLFEEYLPEPPILEVVDLAQEPQRATQDRILAIPTLVRTDPSPVIKIFGDFADLQALLRAFGLPDVRRQAAMSS